MSAYQGLVSPEGRKRVADPLAFRILFLSALRHRFRMVRQPSKTDELPSLQLEERANHRDRTIEVGSDRWDGFRCAGVHQAQQPGFHDIIGMMAERDVARTACLGGFQQSPPSGSSAGKTVERQLLRPIHPPLDLHHIKTPRPQPAVRRIRKLIGKTVSVQSNVNYLELQRSFQVPVVLSDQVRHGETVNPARDRQHDPLPLGEHRPSARCSTQFS